MPLSWYKDEDHIGYDLGGLKIIRKKRMDALDKLLDRNDSKKVRISFNHRGFEAFLANDHTQSNIILCFFSVYFNKLGYCFHLPLVSNKCNTLSVNSSSASISTQASRTIYDEYNDEEITLSKEELSMIMRIRKGQFTCMLGNCPFHDHANKEGAVPQHAGEISSPC